MSLAFRPARAGDKPGVMEIIAHTPDDYIPDVWDDWLDDAHGELTVAVDDGAVVALSKLSRMADDEWWIEGLRVAPARRLRGIGQAITAHQIAEARRLGGRVLRLATGITNDGSHRIAGRAGFHVLARLVERVAEKLDAPLQASVLTTGDLDAAWHLAHGSDLFKAANGVYVFRWKASPLTRERLSEHLDQGIVVGRRDGRGGLAAWCIVDSDPTWKVVKISALFGTTEGMGSLARTVRAEAGTRGKAMVEVMTPPHPSALEALSIAGYGLKEATKPGGEAHEYGIDVLELRLDE